MRFGEAINALRGGGKSRRESWPVGHFLSLRRGEYAPTILFTDDRGSTIWNPLHTDLLADDWVTLTGIKEDKVRKAAAD